MSDLTWQDPPQSTSGASSKEIWNIVAAQLREHPGQWALVRAAASSPAIGLPAAQRLGLERTTRKTPDGKWDIYMRAPVEAAS